MTSSKLSKIWLEFSVSNQLRSQGSNSSSQEDLKGHCHGSFVDFRSHLVEKRNLVIDSKEKDNVKFIFPEKDIHIKISGTIERNRVQTLKR